MAEWGDGVGRVKQQRFPPFNVRNPRNQLFSVKLRKRRGLAKVIKQKEIKTLGVAGLGSVEYRWQAKSVCGLPRNSVPEVRSTQRHRQVKAGPERSDKTMLSSLICVVRVLKVKKNTNKQNKKLCCG